MEHHTSSPPRARTTTRNWVALVTACVLATGTLALVPGPAMAERWVEAATVASPTAPLSTSVVDTHASGNSAVVWRTATHVMVSRRQPGGAWGPPDAFAHNGALPSVAVFVSATNTTVVWRTGGSGSTIQSTSASHGQPWQDVQTLAGSTGNTNATWTALDDGTVVAAWTAGSTISYARLGLGGTWSEPSAVPAPPGTQTVRALVGDSTGALHLVASAQPPTGSHTLWSTSLIGSAWSSPATFATAAVSSVHLTTGPGGTQHVAWTMGTTSTVTQVRYAQRTGTGPWVSGTLLANSPADAPVIVGGPQVAVEPSGAATVFWRSGTGASASILARTRAPSGTWTATTTLGSGAAFSTPVATVAANGTTHVTWQRAGSVESRRRVAGASAWGATNTVGAGQAPAAGASPVPPTLSADTDGNLVYAWSLTGTSPGLRVRAFDNAGPYAGVSSIPASARVGDLTSLIFEAQDAWLGPAQVAWTFDDSSQTAAGTSVTHVFSTPGTRTLTLTLTDAAGHLRTLKRSIEVLPASVLPTISRLSLTPRKVRLRAPKRKQVLRAKVAVDYNGTLTLTFKRKVVVKTKKGKRTKLKKFATTTHPVRVGTNEIKIGRRPGGKKLKPGKYVVFATAGANVRKVRFRVVR